MRAIRWLVVATACALALSGCPCPSFTKGVRAGVDVIGPEYREYVTRDAALDASSKELRLRTLEELIRLIEEAEKK